MDDALAHHFSLTNVTYITDHVGVAEGDAVRLRGIDARVHACHDEIALGRLQWEAALVKRARVRFGRLLDILLHRSHLVGLYGYTETRVGTKVPRIRLGGVSGWFVTVGVDDVRQPWGIKDQAGI